MTVRRIVLAVTRNHGYSSPIATHKPETQMTTSQTMTLQQAKATAYQVSRAMQKTMEVRQVSASNFTYCERGQFSGGVLVGAFKNGQVVA